MSSGEMFHAFDSEAEVRKSSRNLPHWFQPGVATFVTFRTNDSMPQAAIDLLQRRLRLFLQSQGIDGTIPLNEAIDLLPKDERRSFANYRIATYHKMLDKGFGRCLLRNPEYSEIVKDTLLFHNGTRYDLDRFVIMPNHVHLLAAFNKDYDMRQTLEICLQYSSRRIHQSMNMSGSFWQSEPFDHCIRSAEQFIWVQNYIESNPRKARLRPGTYSYWERAN